MIAAYSVMIAAYSRAGHGKEALTLFNQMQRTCILPNQFTLSSLLPACNHLEAVVEVHEEIIRSGFHSEFLWGMPFFTCMRNMGRSTLHVMCLKILLDEMVSHGML